MIGVDHCFAYLEHLQAEHHRWNCAVLDIRHQFAELSPGTRRQHVLAGLLERLEDFGRELENHFAEEEGGACLEEAVARCPSLRAQAKVLMAEHSQLARELQQLLAAMKDEAANSAALVARFEAFATELKTHECAENQLLQMALGGDAADHDMEGNE
jgi:hypothetical protein